MTRSWRSVFFALAAATMLGCSQGGQGLAGDQELNSKCPPNGCAGKDPDQSQLTIIGPGKTAISLPAATYPFVEFSGECYPSTYLQNRVTVKVVLNGAGEVALGVGDVLPIVAPNGSELKCVNGKYGFVIKGDKMTAGSYVVTVKMIGIDEFGNTHDNPGAGGEFTVNVNRF